MDRLDGVSYPINVMYCTVGWREHVLRYGQRLRTTSVSCSEMRLETMCHHDEFSQGGDVFVAKFQVPRGTNEEDLVNSYFSGTVKGTNIDEALQKQIPQLD